MFPFDFLSILSINYYIFLVAAIIGIGVGIFFFIKFQIPSLYAKMTGGAKKIFKKGRRGEPLRPRENAEKRRPVRVQSAAVSDRSRSNTMGMPEAGRPMYDRPVQRAAAGQGMVRRQKNDTASAAGSGYPFESIEHTVVIHTNEQI